jgi:hypothetical protein
MSRIYPGAYLIWKAAPQLAALHVAEILYIYFAHLIWKAAPQLAALHVAEILYIYFAQQ